MREDGLIDIRAIKEWQYRDYEADLPNEPSEYFVFLVTLSGEENISEDFSNLGRRYKEKFIIDGFTEEFKSRVQVLYRMYQGWVFNVQKRKDELDRQGEIQFRSAIYKNKYHEKWEKLNFTEKIKAIIYILSKLPGKEGILQSRVAQVLTCLYRGEDTFMELVNDYTKTEDST